MNSTEGPVQPVRPASRSTLRWPVRMQLLLPMVAVVLLASFLGTAITAYWTAVRIRREQQDALRRVGRTLAEASFPLSQRVMQQMSGLSGAEFVLIDGQHRVRQQTLALGPADVVALAGLVDSRGADAGTDGPVVTLGSRDYLVDSVAVAGAATAGGPARLYILYPEDELASRVYEAVRPALVAGVAVAAIALLITTGLARRLVRPIHALVVQTARIAEGDFTPMPIARRGDELRDLAESINRMAERLADYEQQVRQHERVRTLGQLGSALAHQLRNAATGCRMAIELHRRDCGTAPDDESLDVALRQLSLMESYLAQFLAIGRPAADAGQRVDVTAVIEEVLALLRPSFAHGGVQLQQDHPEGPVWILGSAEALRQLVTNLVQNAVEAAAAGGMRPPRVAIRTWQADDATGSILVEDTGPGPPEAVCDRLFEPFVTAKPGGVGLGLFVARQIAESHRGRLSWQRHGETTRFVFEFPLFAGAGHGTHPDR